MDESGSILSTEFRGSSEWVDIIATLSVDSPTCLPLFNQLPLRKLVSLVEYDQ